MVDMTYSHHFSLMILYVIMILVKTQLYGALYHG